MVTSFVLVAALGSPLVLGPPPPVPSGRQRTVRTPPHPATIHWAADGVVTGLTGATYLVVKYALPDPGPRMRSSVGSSAGPLDSVALGRFSPRASAVSDVVLGATVLAPMGFHLIEAAIATRRFGGSRPVGWFFQRFGTDLLLYNEAMAINALLTTGIKRLVPRRRPFGHLTLAEVNAEAADTLLHDQAQPGVEDSFLSGHTSWAFTAATAGATLATLKLRDRGTPGARATVGVVWALSLGAATTVGTLRVVAGRHYPTDVLAGAAVGSLIGVAVPLLHVPRGERWFTLAPQGGEGVTGLQIQGVF